MSLLDLASHASASRGYDYYKDKKVRSFTKISDSEFDGTVDSSGNNLYSVHINLLHTKSRPAAAYLQMGQEKYASTK